MSLFEHLDYRKYLSDRAEQLGRGARSAWAQAMDCQKGYLTQVLSEAANLSLEQADRLARHLGFSDTEYEYFLLLIEKARAGTPTLEQHFARKIEELRRKQQALRERYQDDQQLMLQNQVTFYSSWRYAAVHLCLTIERFRTSTEISQVLGLDHSTVRETLDFLVRSGLAVQETGEQYLPTTAHSFLSGNSPLIAKHHLNWRMKALQFLDRNRPENIHYSAVVSLSQKDRQTLRTLLLDTISDFKKTVKDSVHETELQVLTLDFFSLID